MPGCTFDTGTKFRIPPSSGGGFGVTLTCCNAFSEDVIFVSNDCFTGTPEEMIINNASLVFTTSDCTPAGDAAAYNFPADFTVFAITPVNAFTSTYQYRKVMSAGCFLDIFVDIECCDDCNLDGTADGNYSVTSFDGLVSSCCASVIATDPWTIDHTCFSGNISAAVLARVTPNTITYATCSNADAGVAVFPTDYSLSAITPISVSQSIITYQRTSSIDVCEDTVSFLVTCCVDATTTSTPPPTTTTTTTTTSTTTTTTTSSTTTTPAPTTSTTTSTLTTSPIDPCPDCPATSTTPPPFPTPPGGSNCCLRVRYTCDDISWTLDAVNTECVDNTECSPYNVSCSATEFTYEQQDACVCFSLPGTLPDPTCDCG